MEFKVDESKIMDYLYGNLSVEEMQKMQEAISKDDKLKQEIEEISQVMGFMGKLEDTEVDVPTFVFENEAQKNVTFFQTDAFKLVLSIAASLLLLLMSAYVTGFYVSKNANGIMLGFRNTDQSAGVSKEEVRNIMQEVLTQYNQNQDEKLTALESKLSSDIDASKQENMSSIAAYLTANTDESMNLMKRYIQASTKANQQMIADYFKVSSEQQQEYLNTVMTDFTKFYNTQRKNDLEVIRTGLLEYKNTNDLKQYETEVVLANLIDMVNTQNK